MIKIIIGDENVGKRVDKIIRKSLPFCPLGEIFRLFRNGKILLNGKKIKENARAESGEIQILADEDELRKKCAQKQKVESKNKLQIIYEDENLLVCDKPVSVAVQSGKGILAGTSLIEMAQNYAEQKFIPHLAHRIDSDTSGLVLIAKNVEFLRKIQNIWDSELLKKEYLALCHEIFEKKTGKIELNLEKNGLKMNVVKNGGQRCVSHFKVLCENKNFSLVCVKIETGRMHQIRAQLAHINHNILGDKKYGDEFADKELEKDLGIKIERLMLHSYKISFVLEKKRYAFEAQIPNVFGKFGNFSIS
ncbi:MAG: RluA family pseudouridine synthase [Chitinivibrionia bacterium]|nr:RluA family pseudouridine synthase [Chitinivibrionia bacterium]MCL1946768.1 RluA family pseudouridine synthase [Chitinivibrionia bacterium]